MKKFGILIITLSISILNFAQVGMDQWRMHISPNKALDVVKGDAAIFAIMENGLLEYNLEAGEQSTWTVANYLSDVSPSALAYDEQSKNLIIGYSNGNLDLIKNNTVYNLPAIVQSTVNGIKRINRIIVHENLAYLATGVGIVVVNLNKREIKDTYHPSSNEKEFLDIEIFQNSIYTLTQGEVFVGSLNNPFLADPGQWQKMQNVNDYTSTGAYNSIERFNDNLFLGYNHEFYNGDTLFQIENNQTEVFLDEIEINGLNGFEDKFFVSISGGVFSYDSTLTLQENIFQYEEGVFPDPQNACFVNGYYYIADISLGLVKALNAYSVDFIDFNGPRYNTAYRAKWKNGKLSIACGGFSGKSPLFSTDGGASMENEKWVSTAIPYQEMLNGAEAWDFISTAINPKNTDEVAYGSYSGIPMVITKEGLVTDTFSIHNSIIEETGTTGWGYIADMDYDSDGNLWMINANANKPLKVRAENGIWYEFNTSSAIKNKIPERLIIDNNGIKWVSVGGAGIMAFDEGESIEDASDDRYKLLTTGENNGNLPSSRVEALAEDFDGNLWIGTPDGMRVLYNASGIFDAAPGQYDAQKLLIQYGEFVEIVLGTTHITSIAIDGGNRKWIGTASSGVFLLSPDGLEVERNFTTNNSALLSNSILDITINQSNGEVFFVTEDGLISYRSDASKGSLAYDNVNVFPNPVHPEYSGLVTIQGIAYNSDVKITDVSGKLVYQTTSNGGTAVWDGKTMDGNRAATGVYLIWTSVDDEETKGRKVGKVVFIN